MSKKSKEKAKKVISERTAVKAIITSYVCYGLLIFFMFNLLKNSVSSAILANIEQNLPKLGYIVPTMFGIMTICLIHILCRICTLDVFKKCKLDKEKEKYVNRNLKIFFVVIILFSIFYSFISLSIAVNMDLQSVNLSSVQYGQVFSPLFTKELTNEMIKDFNNFKDYAFKDTFISEIFFIIGFISLASFQRKMIETYNDSEKEENEMVEENKEQEIQKVPETVTEAEQA